MSDLRNLILICLLGISLLYSCTEEPPLRLTSAQREQLDTLYSETVIALGKELDSLCEVNTRTQVPLLVDSLLVARQREEDALRKKYQGQ